MKFNPLGERVLIEPLEPEGKTTAGLFIPDKAQEQPQRGIIVAIGDKVTRLIVDNKVVYDKFIGSKFKMGGIEYLVLKEDDILGTLSGD